MNVHKLKVKRRTRRRIGARKRIEGTPSRPRLAIYKSLNHMYAQVIDDVAGQTICAASTRDASAGAKSSGNADAAKQVGKAIAERAKSKGIESVVFDRGGFRFHGRVKALADGAREAGLKF